MPVKNESHDEYGTRDDAATVGVQRQPADDDAGIRWSRDPGGTDDRVVADHSAEEHADADAVQVAGAHARADDADATDIDDLDSADAGVDDADVENRPDADSSDAGVDEATAAAGGVEGAEVEDRTGDADPAVDPAATEPVPAEAPVTAGAQADPTPVDAVWTDADRQGFRERWREVQLHFVDDPSAAVEEAEGLVGDAVEGLVAALTAGVDNLAGWRSADRDTEQLRVAVRRYREFLDRVLGGQ